MHLMSQCFLRNSYMIIWGSGTINGAASFSARMLSASHSLTANIIHLIVVSIVFIFFIPPCMCLLKPDGTVVSTI
jgi:hypothetical protein